MEIRDIVYNFDVSNSLKVMYATLSADLVSSTSLSISEVILVKQKMEDLFTMFSRKYFGFWGRVVRGDSIECVIPDPKDALRIALLIKMALKSLDINPGDSKKLFQTYGARMVIGMGEMRIVDKIEGVMDGESIYISGRGLDEMGSPARGTLKIASKGDMQESLQAVCVLVDAILNNATQRQSEVVYYKLLNKNEQEIADILKIKQSGVNQRSTGAQWYAIDAALKFYEQINWTKR